MIILTTARRNHHRSRKCIVNHRKPNLTCKVFSHIYILLFCAILVLSSSKTVNAQSPTTPKTRGKTHAERVNVQLSAILAPLRGVCMQRHSTRSGLDVRWCHGSGVYVRESQDLNGTSIIEQQHATHNNDWRLVGGMHSAVTAGPEFDLGSNKRFDTDEETDSSRPKEQSRRTGMRKLTWTTWAPLPNRAIETFSTISETENTNDKAVLVDIRCCGNHRFDIRTHNSSSSSGSINNNNNNHTFIHGVHVVNSNKSANELSVNLTVCSSLVCPDPPTAQQSAVLRSHVRDLFDHAYSSYITNAWPWDELCPLTCTPRRWDNKSRGTLDDNLGGFSLTLIDSLDALAVMGDLEGFFDALDRVQAHVHFDRNVEVSVFEATIRVLGGLLSAHMLLIGPLADYPETVEYQYNGKWLLDLSTDLATRLLLAFDTPTGIPYHRVNLQRGVLSDETKLTCTAAAGTLLVEWGVLSRLTGDPKFERAAKMAVRALWARRTPLNLVGNTISVETGRWESTHSGNGAGVDSFFEYLMKAYVILGDAECLEMFNSAYAAASEHYAFGPWHIDVDLAKGKEKPVGYVVSALQAFWPGMQILAGKVSEAVVSHFAFVHLWALYGAIPDAFDLAAKTTTAYGKSYHLRPELAESTMHCYAATRNPIYLEFGREMLERLEALSRVECGFASVKDVATGELEDRMDSFLTSETLKYLYILFDLGAQQPHTVQQQQEHQQVSGSGDEVDRCRLGLNTAGDCEESVDHLPLLPQPKPPRGSWGEWVDPQLVVFSTEGHIMWLTPNLRDGESPKGGIRSKLSEKELYLLHHSVCPLVTNNVFASETDEDRNSDGGGGGGGIKKDNQQSCTIDSPATTMTAQKQTFPTTKPDARMPSDFSTTSTLKTVSMRATLSVRQLVSAMAVFRQDLHHLQHRHHHMSGDDSIKAIHGKALPQSQTMFSMVISARGRAWSTDTPTSLVLLDAIPSNGCYPLQNIKAIKRAVRRTRGTSFHARGAGEGGGRVSVGVLVDQGVCALGIKAKHVEQAGAQALILVRKKKKSDDMRTSGSTDEPSSSAGILIGAIPEKVGRLIREHKHLLFRHQSPRPHATTATSMHDSQREIVGEHEEQVGNEIHWLLQVPNECDRKTSGCATGSLEEGSKARNSAAAGTVTNTNKAKNYYSFGFEKFVDMVHNVIFKSLFGQLEANE